MIKFLAFTLRMLKDQRGEAGDKDDSSSDDNQNNDDVLDDDDVVVIDPDDLEDDDDNDDDDDLDKTGDEDLKAEIAKRDELLKKQGETIKESNRNLYGMRKKFEALEAKGDDKNVKITDEQFKGMLEEHQDDPGMLLQIFKQVSKQTAGDEAKVHVDAAEISQRKKDMDSYLTSSWPDAFVEGTKDYNDIQQAKDYLHLNDHPLGDSLAGAMTMFIQMPDELEKAKKEAREGALKVEENRKKTIKQNSLEAGKKKTASSEVSSSELAVAKQLGLSKAATKIYKKLRDNAKTASMEV